MSEVQERALERRTRNLDLPRAQNQEQRARLQAGADATDKPKEHREEAQGAEGHAQGARAQRARTPSQTSARSNFSMHGPWGSPEVPTA